MSNKLSIMQRTRLATLEAIVERGLSTFLDVGTALAEIKESKLYLGGYDTFEDYLLKRWRMSKSRAYQLINGYHAVQQIKDQSGSRSSTRVDDLRQGESTIPFPANEKQTRQLLYVPKDKQWEVWSAAVTTAGGEQPTAKQVADAVAAAGYERPGERRKPERRKNDNGEPSNSEAAASAEI